MQALPLTLDGSSYLDKETEPQPVNKFRYLYTGSNQGQIQLLESLFPGGSSAAGLEEAREFLETASLYNGQLPDVIIIDQPLDRAGLIQFHGFLRREKICHRTIVLYLRTRLNEDDCAFVRRLHLVDDAVDLSAGRFDLHKKILFLKRVQRAEEKELMAKRKAESVSLRKKLSRLTKRSFDIIVSSAALLICSPLLLLIAIALKCESRAPVFYVSKRAGRGFRIFNFYKFRSMVADADKKVAELAHLNQYQSNGSGPAFFKLSNDPRVTRLGKFLRNTSLDELPQLLNVIKGDMSLVGNRPLPVYEAVTLTTNEFVERFSAPAGITGLWQIKKRGKGEMSAEERIRLDITYSRKCNTLFDLKIIASTPFALFQKTNV